MEPEEITHVLFLGISASLEENIEELKRETNHLKGRLFKIEELPDGFELHCTPMGYWLVYKEVVCSKALFRYDGKEWFSWIRDERQTPQEYVEEHNQRERKFAEEDPNYKPNFVEFQGHAPGPGGPSRRDLAEGPDGSGADRKKSGGMNE
jgi:hypothetical protein